MNKKKLAVLLSKLKTFEEPALKLEQYCLDSEVAASILWFAYLNNDIKNKTIADLGCGTGILGLGALVLGAKKVYFVDIDKSSLAIAKQNLDFLKKEFKIKPKAIFLNQHIEDFKRKVDIILQNPPFGVREKHKDKIFLTIAMKSAPVIYSLHKIESENFIKKFTEENNFKVEALLKFNLPLKRTLKFHKKKIYFVKVGCWKLVKNRNI